MRLWSVVGRMAVRLRPTALRMRKPWSWKMHWFRGFISGMALVVGANMVADGNQMGMINFLVPVLFLLRSAEHGDKSP